MFLSKHFAHKSFPAMILAMIALSNVEVGMKVEASLQNLAAGLILAAVGCELFPLMVNGNRSDCFIGISVGFVIGLGTIYGVEYIIGFLESLGESDEVHPEQGSGSPDSESKHLIYSVIPQGRESGNEFVHDIELQKVAANLGNVKFDESHVEAATEVLHSSPEHKKHLRDHLDELLDTVKLMEERTEAWSNSQLSVRDAEEIGESIDEKIHDLQYMLDHARRYARTPVAFATNLTLIIFVCLDCCKVLNLRTVVTNSTNGSPTNAR
jgi:hypothetical protein